MEALINRGLFAVCAQTTGGKLRLWVYIVIFSRRGLDFAVGKFIVAVGATQNPAGHELTPCGSLKRRKAQNDAPHFF
jgi:hypothetical protein